MIHNQRGAVALLTTVIISILLSIIVLGLVSLMISELRQSEDAEQSIRAYYAAQSGVEDAVQKVIANPGVAQGCSSNLSLDGADQEVGWTCQQIIVAGSPSGTLNQSDQANQVNLGSAQFSSMTLSWDESKPPFASGFFTVPTSLPGNGPSITWNHPAVVELAIIAYPSTGFNADDTSAYKITNLLAIPRTSGGSVAYGAIQGSNPVFAKCGYTPGSTYNCSITITGFKPTTPATNYIMRIRTRYAGTDYQMQFLNSSGLGVSVPDGSAMIDVTAKAGNVYRRVIYNVPYQNGAADGLNYVIYSDTNVCKNFSVFNNVASGGCGDN